MGEYKDGKRVGKGIYYLNDSSVKGTFVSQRITGEGIMISRT